MCRPTDHRKKQRTFASLSISSNGRPYSSTFATTTTSKAIMTVAKKQDESSISSASLPSWVFLTPVPTRDTLTSCSPPTTPSKKRHILLLSRPVDELDDSLFIPNLSLSRDLDMEAASPTVPGVLPLRARPINRRSVLKKQEDASKTRKVLGYKDVKNLTTSESQVPFLLPPFRNGSMKADPTMKCDHAITA